MNNSLPKLAVSDPAQILIHPDHAQGTLIIPKNNTSTKPHAILNLLGIFAIIFLLILFTVSYFFIPRTRTVIYARSTAETFGEVSEKTDKVADSLDTLYKLLTTGPTSEGTTEINSNVLSANDSSQNDLWSSAEKVFTAAKIEALKEGQVKGFSVPETDPNKSVRSQRQVAKNVADKKKEAESSVALIKALTSEKVSTSAKTLKEDIGEVKTQTDKYLSEAEKTSIFYVKISDASLELYGLADALNSQADLKNAISQLTSLRGEFADTKANNLAEEMTDLNSDVVDLFDLLIVYFKDIDSEKYKTSAALAASYYDFLNQAKTIAAQTQSHELSFWQNNDSLANYEDLADAHTELIKEATKVRKDNNYFLLPMLGVN